MRVTAVRDRVSPPKVLATTEARASLPQTSREFAKKGAKAAPVFFGAHRRATGVMLSYERYLKLAGGRERVAAALEQQAREAGETLDAEEAMELANSELHAMRRQRRAPKRR